MLDADEEGIFVGTPRKAGDLAFPGPHHESPDLAGRGITDQHLIVALALEIAGFRVLGVGSNP